MDTRLMRGRDLTALTAAGLAVVMAGVYVWLMNAQGDAARPWFAGVLVAGALLCAYGSRSDLSYRRPVLLVAAAGLSGVGVLALPTIGWPIIGAAALAFLASTHSSRAAAR